MVKCVPWSAMLHMHGTVFSMISSTKLCLCASCAFWIRMKIDVALSSASEWQRSFQNCHDLMQSALRCCVLVNSQHFALGFWCKSFTNLEHQNFISLRGKSHLAMVLTPCIQIYLDHVGCLHKVCIVCSKTHADSPAKSCLLLLHIHRSSIR